MKISPEGNITQNSQVAIASFIFCMLTDKPYLYMIYFTKELLFLKFLTIHQRTEHAQFVSIV